MNPWTLAGTILGWAIVVIICLVLLCVAAGIVTVFVFLIISAVQTIRDSVKDKFAPRRGILTLLPRRKETDDATDPTTPAE